MNSSKSLMFLILLNLANLTQLYTLYTCMRYRSARNTYMTTSIRQCESSRVRRKGRLKKLFGLICFIGFPVHKANIRMDKQTLWTITHYQMLHRLLWTGKYCWVPFRIKHFQNAISSLTNFSRAIFTQDKTPSQMDVALW